MVAVVLIGVVVVATVVDAGAGGVGAVVRVATGGAAVATTVRVVVGTKTGVAATGATAILLLHALSRSDQQTTTAMKGVTFLTIRIPRHKSVTT